MTNVISLADFRREPTPISIPDQPARREESIFEVMARHDAIETIIPQLIEQIVAITSRRACLTACLSGATDEVSRRGVEMELALELGMQQMTEAHLATLDAEVRALQARERRLLACGALTGISTRNAARHAEMEWSV